MLISSPGITRTLHQGEISHLRGESQISKIRLHPQTLSQTGLISCARERRVVHLSSPALLVLLNVLSESTSYDRAEPNDLQRSHFILDRNDTWKLLQCLLVRIWERSRLLCYQFTPNLRRSGLPRAWSRRYGTNESILHARTHTHTHTHTHTNLEWALKHGSHLWLKKESKTKQTNMFYWTTLATLKKNISASAAFTEVISSRFPQIYSFWFIIHFHQNLLPWYLWCLLP